ncbi:hypothetical protein Hdeb2414_s0022g00617451 [Helianthus debilis subsp. tardiflorus]
MQVHWLPKLTHHLLHLIQMTTRQRFGRNAPVQWVLDAKPVSMRTVLHCVYYSNDNIDYKITRNNKKARSRRTILSSHTRLTLYVCVMKVRLLSYEVVENEVYIDGGGGGCE